MEFCANNSDCEIGRNTIAVFLEYKVSQFCIKAHKKCFCKIIQKKLNHHLERGSFK